MTVLQLFAEVLPISVIYVGNLQIFCSYARIVLNYLLNICSGCIYFDISECQCHDHARTRSRKAAEDRMDIWEDLRLHTELSLSFREHVMLHTFPLFESQ